MATCHLQCAPALYSSAGIFTCGLAGFFADHGNFLVSESFFIEPIGTGNFFEGVDGCLNTLCPGNGDKLDVTMHVSSRKYSSSAGSILVLVDDTLAVWTNCVAMPSPSLAEYLGVKYRIEQFPIDQLISKFAVESLGLSWQSCNKSNGFWLIPIVMGRMVRAVRSARGRYLHFVEGNL